MNEQKRVWAAPRMDQDELELERLKRLNEEAEIEMQDCLAVLEQLEGNLAVDPEDLEQLQSARPTTVVRHAPMATGLRC